MSDPIAQDRRSRGDRPILDDLERCVGLEPRDNTAAGLMELRPVEDVGRSRLDRHLRSLGEGVAEVS